MDFLTTIQYEMNIKLNNYVTQVIIKNNMKQIHIKACNMIIDTPQNNVYPAKLSHESQ